MAKYPPHLMIQGKKIGVDADGEDRYTATEGHLICQNCGKKDPFTVAGMSIGLAGDVMKAAVKSFAKSHSKCKPKPGAPA